MLTGDNESFAKLVSEKVNIDKYYAELLPNEKYLKLQDLKETIYRLKGENNNELQR